MIGPVKDGPVQASARLRSREGRDRILRTREKIRDTRDLLRLNRAAAEHVETAYLEQSRVAIAVLPPVDPVCAAMFERVHALVAISNDLIDLSDKLIRMTHLRLPLRLGAPPRGFSQNPDS